MDAHLTPVTTVDDISPGDFKSDFLQASKPLVIRGGLSRDWPAYEKWTYDYLKAAAGRVKVPLYDNRNVGPQTMLPRELMTFGDYLDVIASGPTELHLFALNIFKYAPTLCRDFSYPEGLLTGFIKRVPTLFVGGAGAMVHLHYDFDYPNLIHTQFHGRKRAVLFGPEESARLYQLPGTVQSPVDFEHPDLKKYPRVAGIAGLEAIMEHGDTLFIPAGWWHFMHYLEPGYALTLRARSPVPSLQLQGALNAFVLFNFDKLMRRLAGPRWFKWQERGAMRRAQAAPARRFETQQPVAVSATSLRIAAGKEPHA
jgi:hypothetical protein